MTDKYVVYKADHLKLVGRACGVDYYEEVEGRQLTDCVVIRLQDRFASAGLHGYASCIQGVIEAAKDAGVPLPGNLEEVRDYFFEMAEAAEHYPRKKWPD